MLHLTVGHDHDLETLRSAEEVVSARLPFTQPVTRIELWTGTSPVSGGGTWRPVRAYPLG